jgi:uncharacterized protein (TIGR00255 family)
MISSMTGFGQAERSLKNGKKVSCEIKTVNHRFCEIVCRLPRVLFPYEDRIKAIVRDSLERGYITVRLTMDESDDLPGALEVDYDYARKYHRLLENLKDKLGLNGDIDVSLFIQRPGVIKETGEKVVSEKDWLRVKKAIEIALSQVETSRKKEGSKLLSDMKARGKHIGSLVERVEKKSPDTVQTKRENLLKKMAQLGGDAAYSGCRIEEEISIFADRCDVVEECVRLKSHLDSLESMFKQDHSVGRKLTFMLQEMNREANTIASKAQDAEISQWVVVIKEELERMREQAENLV